MTLLAPLGLAALLAVPILVLLYLLKVRYRDHEVGSTYLWERLARDLAVHEPWQRPRFSVLLLIQALVLVGLTLALARPAIVSGTGDRAHAVLVLDASASMTAIELDDGSSRFDRAQALARDAAAALPDGSTGTVILAGARPVVLVAETTERSRLLSAIDGAAATDAAGDMETALRMAVALARGRANGQVLVYSDGAFAPPRLEAEDVRVSFTSVGGGDDNRAIVAMDARSEPQNRRRHQVFVRVQNYAATSATATVALRADGAPFDAQTLELAPGGAAAVVFGDLPADARVLEARILEPDALAADDGAWIVLERREPTRVLLVTQGSFFLERVLALLPDAELFRVQPRRLGAIDAAAYDVLIFDGTLPDIPPRGPMLVVNHQDGAFLPVRGLIRAPGPLDWATDDPVLRYVDLRGVRIGRMAQVETPGWARAVVDAEGAPAILAGETNGRRVVLFTFDLRSSTLPLSPSFPILMSNVIGYLEPPRTLDTPVARPSALVHVLPKPGADELLLATEGGILRRQPIDGAATTVEAPAKVGSYVVQQLGAGRTLAADPLAVSLIDAVESDLRPLTTTLPSGTPPTIVALPGSRELWVLLALAALGILTVEWWWFHRRA